MSSKTPYAIIKEYYVQNKTNDKLIEKILLHTFYEEYDELVKAEKESRSELSEDEINGFRNSLLSKINLKKNEEIAKAEIGSCVESKTRIIVAQNKVKNALSIIGLNVVSSIIFTLLLIVLFFLAENQIKPLVQEYIVPHQIENAGSKKQKNHIIRASNQNVRHTLLPT